MAFRFKSATAVAVGTFNIYIVQPRWLTQIGLLKQGEKVKFETDFSRPGFRFSVPDSRIRWNVQPDRLMIDTESHNEDCGVPMARVLEVLMWTPLMGVGTNLEFEADETSILEKIKCKLPECDPPKAYSIGQRTWHVALKQDSQIFNVQVSYKPREDSNEGDKLILSLNVHTDIPRTQKQEEANKLATASARQFLSHSSQAASLASQILGVEVIR